MTLYTLQAIRDKIRKVTGRPSVNQITDAEIDEYINTFLRYDLPEHLRLFILRTKYSFNLSPNQPYYNFADKNNYLTVESPAYVAGYDTQFFQDYQVFKNLFPEKRYVLQLSVGTGVAGPYGGTFTYTPVKPTTVFISTVDNAGNSLVCKDDGLGNLTGNIALGATVNYQTGAVAGITWTGVISAGTVIYMQAANYQVGRPVAVLFFNNTFEFWPVPDKAYLFEVTAYKNPLALVNPPDEPDLREWWEFIAWGASLKIFADNLDMESYAKAEGLFERHKILIERRTLKQLSTQRARTIYSDYDSWPYSSQYPYM